MALGGKYRIKWIWVVTIALLAAIVVIVLLLLRDVDLTPQIKFAQDHATLAATIIALASLVTVTFATWMNWRATRRQATLEAWTKWSDDTADDRKLISKVLGVETLTPQQAETLVKGTQSPTPTASPTRLQKLFKRTAPSAEGNFTAEQQRALVHAAVAVLNGLERLAVGVELGVYRRAVLIDVGGTIIKRSYERFEPYIELRRTHPDPVRRQEKAYVALERLAHRIRYNEVDAERLKSLRRQP